MFTVSYQNRSNTPYFFFLMEYRIYFLNKRLVQIWNMTKDQPRFHDRGWRLMKNDKSTNLNYKTYKLT